MVKHINPADDERMDRNQETPRWMTRLLIAAGLYNLVWGTLVILFPTAIFRFASMELPRYPEIWQCVGMIVGVYGIGYLIAAASPYRHWPIVFVGLLGKIFGPIGFIGAATSGALPWKWGLTILTNDLIWWAPFAAILCGAFRFHSDTSRNQASSSFDDIISTEKSHRGMTLTELSSRDPTLVLFVRHQGCTFCRENLRDLSRDKAALEANSINLAIVHMSPPIDATLLFEKFGLGKVHRFSDPTCQIYRVFGLRRGTLLQLFGAKVWRRAILEGVLARFGFGKLEGDGFRMPGTFLVHRGEIIAADRAQTAADRISYATWALQQLGHELTTEVKSPDAQSQVVVTT